MEKRMNRSDILFSLAFLLMLIIAVGAFFYGVKVGTENTTAKFETTEENVAASTPAPYAYQQQDLVSFYHTVFLPYREFQNDWFAAQNKWLADPTADRAMTMKELAKTADQKYNAIKLVYVPNISTKLKDAQTEYMKSLKLFSQSFSEMSANANALSADAIVDEVNADAYFRQGREHSLAAQQNYYASMLKWASNVNSDLPGDYERPAILSIDKWKELSLIIKLKVTADYLAEQALMTDFTPQDLTARIDQFIESGQADKRKLKSFNAIAELLTSTEGVRQGDFLNMKARYYADDQLPQLPFFYSSN